ncbi:MAG: response regulator transcription factor [Ignavibacteriales bacterium]|nr:response regulator transcription factor [Ignavibacteriales bacterium]
MKTIKILLADDNDGFRRVLSLFLEQQEHVEIVGEAKDGVEAIELAEKFHPDLIFMDLDMPGRDGFEATREIKLRSPHTKVVVLSMHGADIYRRNAWRHAADGFVDKAEMKDDLLEIISREQRRLAASAVTVETKQ